jgi:hypothetical protein
LIHDGPVTKAKSGRKIHAYLFSDVLLFVEPKLTGGVEIYRKV